MHEFWLQRWAEGKLGFHRSEVNDALTRHWRAGAGSVLVPLCGKSLDLRWLAEQGHAVVGVELAERAVRDFFTEQGLAFDRRYGALPCFVARELPIAIWQGDVFALDGVRCDALYDRAALIALPPELRPRYAAHTDGLLRDGAERLVVTFAYDQTALDGPPYSVPDDELLGYWPELVCVERRDVRDDVPPRFREAGLSEITESVWRTPGPGGA
jgi:thiopurine S-methyltransferase